MRGGNKIEIEEKDLLRVKKGQMPYGIRKKENNYEKKEINEKGIKVLL